jgi:hypothetical protein
MQIHLNHKNGTRNNWFDFTVTNMLSQCGMRLMGGLTFSANQNACNSFVELLLEYMENGEPISSINNYNVAYSPYSSGGESVEYTIDAMRTGQLVMSDILNTPHIGPFALYYLTKDKYKKHWIPPVHFSRNPNYDNAHHVCVFGLSATNISRQKADRHERTMEDYLIDINFDRSA